MLALVTLTSVLGVTSLAARFLSLPEPERAPLLAEAESPLSSGAGDSRARGGLGHLATKERGLLDAVVDLPAIRSTAVALLAAGEHRRGFPSRLHRPPIA
jgi:hypothetical protein